MAGSDGEDATRHGEVALGLLHQQASLRAGGPRLQHVRHRGHADATAILGRGKVHLGFPQRLATGHHEGTQRHIVVERERRVAHHVGDGGVVGPVRRQQRVARRADTTGAPTEVQQQPGERGGGTVDGLLHGATPLGGGGLEGGDAEVERQFRPDLSLRRTVAGGLRARGGPGGTRVGAALEREVHEVGQRQGAATRREVAREVDDLGRRRDNRGARRGRSPSLGGPGRGGGRIADAGIGGSTAGGEHDGKEDATAGDHVQGHIIQYVQCGLNVEKVPRTLP